MLKDTVSQIGLDAIKQFLESYEVTDNEIIVNGETHRFKYVSTRNFLTPFGTIDVDRKVFQHDRGGKAVIPLDRKWGMEREYATLDVREAVLYSTAHNTPEETVKILRKFALYDIHPTTIKRITDKTGTFFEEHKESMKSEIFEKEEQPSDFQVVVASMDGVNVLLNEKGKKPGRPKEKPYNDEKDVEGYAYKNAMCGSISFYIRGDGTKENKPERVGKRYVSKMPEEKAITFKSDFERELINIHEANKNQFTEYVMLCDGALSIWSYVENNPLYKNYKFLVDFYHATEHLSKAAEAIFGKSNAQGKQYYKKWHKRLQNENGAANSIYRSLVNYRNTYQYSDSRLEALDAEITFFKRNKNKMNYAEFLSSGLPIGSGPVEAACKSIVRQRMCRSGQRWSRKKADNVLQLRTLVKSDRWEICWDWYKRQKKIA
jgi:hypothetical protein